MNLGKLDAFIKANGLQQRPPNRQYEEWLSSMDVGEPLRSFLLNHTPSGDRMAGVVTLLGYQLIMEIDKTYRTSCEGRLIVFAHTGDGSYVAVNADTGVVGWILSGCLSPENLADGWIEFPGAIGDFLFQAENDEDFPSDPFVAQKRYGTKI